jgi:segregation and condensation protein A
MTYATPSVNIQLPQFEGPLALLLYLIRKEEMDILDIPITKITQQYLDYIKLMKELDLEVAGEFIAMAATLLQIKSRMLLPTYDENGEIVENEDPRKELVRRLIEYQAYQEASKLLYQRPLLGRDVFARGLREKLQGKEEEIILEDNALYSLIAAYRMAMKSIKKRVHQVASKAQSIASRIFELKDRLIVGHKVALSELINAIENKKQQILITFLSALELGKMGFVGLYQSDVYGEIWIEARKPIDGEMISRVEEYDNLHSEEAAAKMLEKSAQKVDFTEEDFAFESVSEQELVNTNGSAQTEFADILATTESSESHLTTEIGEKVEEVATDEEIAHEELKMQQEIENV